MNVIEIVDACQNPMPIFHLGTGMGLAKEVAIENDHDVNGGAQAPQLVSCGIRMLIQRVPRGFHDRV